MQSLESLIATDPSVAPAFREAMPVRIVPCHVCTGRSKTERRGAMLIYHRCSTCGGAGSIVEERA